MLLYVVPGRTRIAELPHGEIAAFTFSQYVNRVMKLPERKTSCLTKNIRSRKTENRSGLCPIKI